MFTYEQFESNGLLGRVVPVFALGAVTAWALFFIMQALVSVPLDLPDASEGFKITYVRLIEDTPVPTPDRKPERPLTREVPPPTPTIAPIESLTDGMAIDGILLPIDPRKDFVKFVTPGASGGGARGPVPVVRVDPNYPPRARQQGIEGFVDLQFTITAVGTISNVQVIRSEPPSVFDREAVRAVRRWRYTPQVKGGVAVDRPLQSVRLEFELPKDGRR